MSYEVIYEKEIPCPCGKGKIKHTVRENDFFQTKKSVTIECPVCSMKYNITSEIHTPKPKHEYTVYYAVPANGMDEPIRLDL